MELFKRDLTILFQKNDINKNSYNILLMYCELYEIFIIDNDIIYNTQFIKDLYKRYNFGRVQREKNDLLEHTNLIKSFFMLIDIIGKFYKFPVDKINIIERNIYTITKNTEKQFKTGLIEFLHYINLYIYIFNNHLESDIDIILQNRKFFRILLEYNKDILTDFTFPECVSVLKEKLSEYTASSHSLLWMLQHLISSYPEHSKCAFNIMKQLLISYSSIDDERLKKALINVFTIKINPRYTRIFTLFIELFFELYPEIDIDDYELNKCKVKESQIIVCPNDFTLRICDERIKEITDQGHDPKTLCPK